MSSWELIQEAASRLNGLIRRTPVLRSDWIDRQLGTTVWFKAETLQHTGSFKVRGAMHFLTRLAPAEAANGVVAYSSGNHAQALAWAASQKGIPATIVMPSDAPRIKLEGTRFWGASVVTYDRFREDRTAIAQGIADQTGAILVPPFDHPWIIAGQGTVAQELFNDLATQGVQLDSLLVPCSGGGLTAGTVLVRDALSPETAVYAVEPADYNDTALSIQAGHRVSIPQPAPALCDSLALLSPGEVTFPINQPRLQGVPGVSDEAVKEAMRWLYHGLKLVVEPGGAIGLAALLSGQVPASAVHGVILSGGNVAPDAFAEILSQGADMVSTRRP
jgi:threonine dehydratase